jgi:hypothetical protein
VASLPFYNHLFYTECRFATFVMEGFLLVETANIFMNTLGFLDNVGRKKTTVYTVLFYINFIGWPIWRMIWPLLMVLLMWLRVYYDARTAATRECLIPTMVCGHIILVFCTVVFFGVLVPDLLRRCSPPPLEEDADQKKEGEELDGVPYGEGTAVVGVAVDDVVLTEDSATLPVGRTTTAPSSAHQSPRSRPTSQPPSPANLQDVGALVKESVSEIFEGATHGERRRSVVEGVTLQGEQKDHDGATFLK